MVNIVPNQKTSRKETFGINVEKINNPVFKANNKSQIKSKKYVLPENVTIRLIYSENILKSMHYAKCIMPNVSKIKCSKDYTGETVQRLLERILYHNGRDAKSDLVKHATENICINITGKKVIEITFLNGKLLNLC